ncbi:DUF4381 domain-containing protein [Roseiconus nitratireducens]|uniref:DUF4381 domain-containing protein n=1 Tax=Roseiconus nitratireducens TaxID=2605748 RepID=A0A5M6DLK7_9BACT|nr:DUF4381 domain-containing protein [Roseiconus nitratireducens]KAA5547286.1 DUF4381 domain-containing protein [Roseiconus nitratireducens]
MNDESTSLDRLNDIVMPPDVPWWPPAPGWYVVMMIVLAIVIALLLKQWQRWRGNAYRRSALKHLETTRSAAGISELLRRTALVIASRSTVAGLTGSDWPNWLARQCPDPMPEGVKSILAGQVYRSHVYRSSDADPEVSSTEVQLRDYAAAWIRHHRSPQDPDKSSDGNPTLRPGAEHVGV